MAPVVAEFQRICEICRNPFITAVRYPSIRPRRTCSRSCAARLPRRHQPLSERFSRYVTAYANVLVVDRTAAPPTEPAYCPCGNRVVFGG